MNSITPALRARVLHALGMAIVAGCQPVKVEIDHDSGRYTPDDTGTATGGGESGGGSGGPPDGYVDCGEVPDLTLAMIQSGWVESALLCQDPPADGACPAVEDFPATQVMYEQFDLESSGWGYDAWASCGPDASRLDACCYEVSVSEWVEGRPFTIAGRARTAAPGEASGWVHAQAVEVGTLEPSDAAWLAERWSRSARYEHASVASFARAAMELLALGAPAALVHATTLAMADEVDHARRCLGVARGLAPEVPGIGALPVAGSLEAAPTPRSVLRAVLREGAIGETLAAAEAAEAARLCADPATRAVLARIAEDESRHAALAWRTARWLVAAHPQLADELDAVVPPTVAPDDPAAPALAVRNAHGVLGAGQRKAVLEDTFAQVIGPALDALRASVTADPGLRA
jgi:hypothetical protein